jgi:uncharacterized protein with HEPN domain/predicted nucleotidyltransferase
MDAVIIWFNRKGKEEAVTSVTEDLREMVMLALNAKFPVLKRLFSIRRIGIFGEFARGNGAADAPLDIEVEFEPGGDTYRNYINLTYYLDELLGRQVSLITRRLAEDFISDDTDGKHSEWKRDRTCLSRMHGEISFLLKRVKGHDLRTFSQDELLRRAAIRSLEVIGECAFLVSPSLRRTHPEIPWTELAGMRFRLVHPFFGPDWILVWDILESDIPGIETPIRKLSGSW